MGHFSIIGEEGPVSITNRKAEELLAYLTVVGRPVRKWKLAELLWPDSPREKAMDSLYKVCRYLKKWNMEGPRLPLQIHREEIYLETKEMDVDLRMFERLYMKGKDPEEWETAVSLYTDPLLFDDCYDWTAQEEARYDIYYGELLERLESYYRKVGNLQKAALYESLLKEFR